MQTTKNDNNWFAHQPWAIPALAVVGTLSIAFHLLLADPLGAIPTMASYGALLFLVLFQRNGKGHYKWCSIMALAVLVVWMVARVGVKQGWW